MALKQTPLDKVFKRGLDTMSAETEVAVRKAENVDIDKHGNVERREGRSTVVSGDNFHSFWGSRAGGMYVIKNDQLHQFNELAETTTALATLNSSDFVEFDEHNGDIFFANRTTTGWLPADGSAARAIGVLTPAAPALAEVSGGSLQPGLYSVAVTQINDRGEESGLSEPTQIELSALGNITVTNLPDTSGYSTRVYATNTDGDQLYLVSEFSTAVSSYTITRTVPEGAVPTTFELDRMPPGDFLRAYGGRLYIAAGDTLWFSEAMRPGLYSKRHGWVKFDEKISFIEPVSGGVYVGDRRGVWFMDGSDPVKWNQRKVSDVRVVPYSSRKVPGSEFHREMVPTAEEVAIWLSQHGYMVGLPNGQVLAVQDEQVRLPGVQTTMRGHTSFLVRKGLKQVITPVNFTGAAPGTAVDSTID